MIKKIGAGGFLSRIKTVVDEISGKTALDATVAKSSEITALDGVVDAGFLAGAKAADLGVVADLVDVPYVEGQTALAFLHTGYYHIHGAAFVYPDKAAPVTLASAAASWAETGNIIEVIPANTIIKDFDLHWASLSDISAVLDGIIDIFAGAVGAEVKIGAVDVVRTANFSRENAVPVQVPQQPANTRISCRFTDSTSSSRTVRVKFYGHVYSTSLT